jgi:hypothetical protein
MMSKFSFAVRNLEHTRKWGSKGSALLRDIGFKLKKKSEKLFCEITCTSPLMFFSMECSSLGRLRVNVSNLLVCIKRIV